MEEFVIDADDGYIPLKTEPVKVRIGGDLYTANCPPDKKWHLFMPLADGDADGGSEAVIHFLESALDPADAIEVMRRMKDPEDSTVTLMKLMYVFGRVLAHYQPMITEHFQAMGMDAPTAAQGAGEGRGERRATSKGSAITGTKGKRTPRAQTGARSGRA
ncbi:hypothetical protein AB0O47_39335 [Streptomyces noursei]|uniref:hypothetical protein n=1 Tax=Streptomyces noursei TaxID=1971 RepID=UPI00344E140C